MESFLSKFVSLVIHLMRSSQKVQILQSSDQNQVALFSSKLSSDLSQEALILNVDAQAYLNNYQQDFFLDWAADQFEAQLSLHPEKFDSPWLIVITQADLLNQKVLAQLFTLKHQRESAQLHLLFQFKDEVNVEQFLSSIDDVIVKDQLYHIHSLPKTSKMSWNLNFLKNLMIFCLVICTFLAGLYWIRPSSIYSLTQGQPHTGVELFTDNSLNTWSQKSQERLDELGDEIKQLGEHQSEKTKQSYTKQSQESAKNTTVQKSRQQPQVAKRVPQETTSAKRLYSWQLIAFNNLKQASHYQQKNCSDTCYIAKNKDYYVVLFGQYSSHSQGMNQQAQAQQIMNNAWLRESSNLHQVR